MVSGGPHHTKPTAIKLLKGAPGRSAANPNEPQPERVAPSMPSSLDRYGKEAWRRNAPALERLGLLTEIDGDALALYCDAYSQWRRASRAVRKIDPTSESYRQVAITVERARDQMRYLAGEFGMTPASRSRVKVASEAPTDTFQELFGGVGG